VTVTYSPAQTGTENIAGAAWVATTVAIGAAFNGGYQYTIPAPNELLFRSLIFTITPTAGAGAGTLGVELCNDLDEAVFSNTNLPSTQATISVYSAAVTLVVGTAQACTLTLGVEPLQTGSFVGETESAMQVLGHSGFQGNVALVVTWDGTLSTFATTATLVGDETPFLTGIHSGKTRQSRADWCPRCGTPMFREHFIKDGYTKTLVCPSCYDPPVQRRRLVVNPKEVNP